MADEPTEQTEQPVSKVFTEQEVNQLVSEAKSAAERSMQSKKDREIAEAHARRQMAEHITQSTQAELEAFLSKHKDVYPELYNDFQAERQASQLSTRENIVAAREMSAVVSQNKKDWTEWVNNVAGAAGLAAKDVAWLDEMLSSNDQQWIENSRTIEHRMQAIIDSKEKAKLAAENAELTKKLGKAQEDKELGTPLPLAAGGGGGKTYKRSDWNRLSVSQQRAQAAEWTEAAQQGRLLNE